MNGIGINEVANAEAAFPILPQLWAGGSSGEALPQGSSGEGPEASQGVDKASG